MSAPAPAVPPTAVPPQPGVLALEVGSRLLRGSLPAGTPGAVGPGGERSEPEPEPAGPPAVTGTGYGRTSTIELTGDRFVHQPWLAAMSWWQGPPPL